MARGTSSGRAATGPGAGPGSGASAGRETGTGDRECHAPLTASTSASKGRYWWVRRERVSAPGQKGRGTRAPRRSRRRPGFRRPDQTSSRSGSGPRRGSTPPGTPAGPREQRGKRCPAIRKRGGTVMPRQPSKRRAGTTALHAPGESGGWPRTVPGSPGGRSSERRPATSELPSGPPRAAPHVQRRVPYGGRSAGAPAALQGLIRGRVRNQHPRDQTSETAGGACGRAAISIRKTDQAHPNSGQTGAGRKAGRTPRERSDGPRRARSSGGGQARRGLRARPAGQHYLHRSTPPGRRGKQALMPADHGSQRSVRAGGQGAWAQQDAMGRPDSGATALGTGRRARRRAGGLAPPGRRPQRGIRAALGRRRSSSIRGQAAAVGRSNTARSAISTPRASATGATTGPPEGPWPPRRRSPFHPDLSEASTRQGCGEHLLDGVPPGARAFPRGVPGAAGPAVQLAIG